MTRKKYIEKMQNYLRFLLPEKEIADILSDIEECFDAGKGEGKTEEQIANDLGEPKNVVKDILSERREPVNIARGQLAQKCLPPAVCVALGTVYIKWIYFSDIWGEELLCTVIGIILPLVMWLVLEREKFIKGLFAERIDMTAFAGAVMIFLSAPMFQPLANGILAGDRKALVYFALAVTGLIAAAHIMLIISVFRTRLPKYLCAVPAVMIGITISAICTAAWNYGIFRDDFEYFLRVADGEFVSVLSSADTARYFSYFGGILEWYIKIIIASEIIFFIWAVINRNALTVPMLYLTVIGGSFTVCVRVQLLHIDPLMPYSIIKFGSVPTAGIISAAASLIAVCAARLVYRIKNAPLKDGES